MCCKQCKGPNWIEECNECETIRLIAAEQIKEIKAQTKFNLKPEVNELK